MKQVMTTVWTRDCESRRSHPVRPGYTPNEELTHWFNICKKSQSQGKIVGFRVELKEVEECQD